MTEPYALYMPRSKSDNVSCFFFGPWAQNLAGVFDQIDNVRREGGFNVPYSPYRTLTIAYRPASD